MTFTSTFPGKPSSPSGEVCVNTTPTLSPLTNGFAAHTYASHPRAPPCRLQPMPAGALLSAGSLYVLPSILNWPFAMRLP